MGAGVADLHTRFYIDPETGDLHILSHEVEEREVMDVLDSPNEDRAGRDGARIAIGRTSAGRYLRVIYVPDPEPDHVFVYHGVRVKRQTSSRIPAAYEKERAMKQKTKFPPGWNEERVQRVLQHYDSLSEDETVAEDEAAFEDPTETVMTVPKELASAVRALIAGSAK